MSNKAKIKTAKTYKNNEKIYKNVSIIKKITEKKLIKKDKYNEKIIEKCNKIITKNDETDKILLKINEYNNNDKKTIVYFVDSFYPVIDGVVSVLDNYCKQMKKYYNIVVCAPKHNGESYWTDNYLVIECESLFMKTQGYDMAFPNIDGEFIKYIRLLKIDLVHIHSPFNMGKYGLNLSRLRNIPSVTTFHSQFKKNFYESTKSKLLTNYLTSMVMKVFQRSTVTVTMNPFAGKIMKEYGLKRDIYYIPNATNLVEKTFDEKLENKILEKHHINKYKFNMIFIGRFVAVKNVYFLIDVLNELKKQNIEFNFIFLGYGPEEEKMKETCKEYGLYDDVIFTGKIDDENEKMIIIKNSNLLFFPSTYEIESIVKLECACYGVPTLCLEDTTLSSNITDNVNGFVCKNDFDDCVERLKVLCKNVDFVKQVGKNAKRDIYLTWDQVREQLHFLYEKLLNTKNLKSAKKNKNNSTKN